MTLAWRCFGESYFPTVVLLHGFMSSGEDWQHLINELTQSCFLITLDLPGHGASLWLEEDNDGFSAFASRLDVTLAEIEQSQSVDLSRFNLLGYSLGGRLAMSYAITHPESVIQLFLESAHTGLVNEHEKAERALSDHAWAIRFQKDDLHRVLCDWYRQPVFFGLTKEQVSSLMVTRADSQSGKHLAEAMITFSLSRQPDYRRLIASQPFPVHYFYGEKDQKFGLLAKQLLAEGVVDSAHSISGSGHNIHWEQPQALARLIRDLIRS